MQNYDLAIIGSGPGGYVAGLYASRHKLKVCVIEKGLVGGTCLNRGCIPTKSLLYSASMVSAMKDASGFGIEIGSFKINFDRMMSRKADVVTRLRTGIETLFKARGVDLVRGRAEIMDPHTLKVNGSADVNAKNIIIAGGSKVAGLPGIEIDELNTLSSDAVLDIRAVPKSIVIIGGGVIGCEFACLFNALGSKVAIIEFTGTLIPSQSREASKKLESILKKRNIDILTSSKAEDIERRGSISNVKVTGGRTIEAEKVLISVGRTPDTDKLGLEGLRIKTEKGRILVDANLRTSVNSIYAIGDCVGGPMLAHKASYDAMVACDNILGRARNADYANIPNCIWTMPEIASVGLSDDEARARHPDARTAKFPYLASGKAYLMGKVEGFVKIIGDSKGAILGVEIFGEEACDLIGEAVLAKTSGLNIREWSRVVHGHPTLSEVLQEAAHVFCGTPIHSV